MDKRKAGKWVAAVLAAAAAVQFALSSFLSLDLYGWGAASLVAAIIAAAVLLNTEK